MCCVYDGLEPHSQIYVFTSLCHNSVQDRITIVRWFSDSGEFPSVRKRNLFWNLLFLRDNFRQEIKHVLVLVFGRMWYKSNVTSRHVTQWWSQVLSADCVNLKDLMELEFWLINCLLLHTHVLPKCYLDISDTHGILHKTRNIKTGRNVISE
jgi:hypothetical protein